jgi:hypothetical protein
LIRQSRQKADSPTGELVESLFSFSEMKKISSHFNPALIFWLFLIKQKEQK